MGQESHDKVFSGTKLTDPKKEHMLLFLRKGEELLVKNMGTHLVPQNPF